MENKKVIKASIYYVLCSFILKGISFLTTPIFSRILTQEEYGYASNFASWMSIISIFATLTLISSLIRARFEFATDIFRYISSILLLGSINTILVFSVILFKIDFFKDFFLLDKKYLILMFFVIATEPAYAIFLQHQRFQYKYKYVTLLTIFVTISSVLLSFAFIYFYDDNLWGKVLGGQLPMILTGFVFYVYYILKEKRINIRYWGYALAICIPYMFHMLSSSILTSFDKTMITSICSSRETALYSMAYNIAMIVNIIWNSFNQAFAPWLGERLNDKNYKPISKVSMVYLGVFSYFIIGLILIAPEALYILGGSRYMGAKYLIPPVMLSYLVVAIDTMFVNVEQYEKKTFGMAMATCGAAIINVILNYIFIPRFGYIAAAYTTLISYFLLLLMNYCIVKRIGMEKVYNTKMFVLLFCIVAIVAFSNIVLYSMDLIRYIVILIYILVSFIILVKYHNTVLNFISNR